MGRLKVHPKTFKNGSDFRKDWLSLRYSLALKNKRPNSKANTVRSQEESKKITYTAIIFLNTDHILNITLQIQQERNHAFQSLALHRLLYGEPLFHD